MTHAVIGRWTAENNDRAFLEFHEDGTLRGSDGANGLATSWSDESAGVTVKPSMTTLKAAPGMITWVTKARRVEADGDRLALFDAAENHLGDLHRQPPGTTYKLGGR
ncbi:META domain-containing protein [Brevibacterium spongiae]|uniref:META domain-containing protein n=1 Tax=Brevibacterium spongiae TaxID=2909672 RepID=A0ABY5STS0_9MICO|nr:META domain-containing protein [Brevibacterium spongiae]UVI37535.1 META domain-containing protein [Brevibacterium spongiae]